MKEDIKRQIYEQTREKPGNVRLNETTAITYKKEPVNTSPAYNPHISWTKKYYSQDKGFYFPHDPLSFSYFSGLSFISSFTSNYGNFMDPLTGSYNNVVYGCTLTSITPRSVTIRPRLANGSVTVYLDTTLIYSSGTSAYIETDINFSLSGTRTLRIFVYKESTNSSFTLFGLLGNQVDGWGSLDVTASPTPEWYGNPNSGYNVSNQSPYVRLRWRDPGHQFYASGISNIEGGANPDIAGFTIWRSVFNPVYPVNGVDTVSGTTFTLDGDLSSQFVAGNQVNLNSGDGGTYTVNYALYDVSTELTTIGVTEAITGSPGQSAYSESLEPIIQIPYSPQSNGIFTHYDYTVSLDTTYKYRLDSFDTLYNRSAKSTVKTVSTYQSPPAQVYDQFANILGYNDIKISWKHDYPTKVKNFNVWDITDGESTTISSVSGTTVTVSDSSIFTIGKPCIVYTGGDYYSEVVTNIDGSDIIIGNEFSTTPSGSDLIYSPALLSSPPPPSVSGQQHYVPENIPQQSQWHNFIYRNADVYSAHRFWVSANSHHNLANYRDFPYTNLITVSGLPAPTYNNSDNLYSQLTDIDTLANATGVKAQFVQYASSVLSPIVATNVITTSPYVDHLAIECATNTAFDPPIGLIGQSGTLTVSGNSKILNPCVFSHTIKGTTYYFRMAQVDGYGNTGYWGSWVSETAGDSTGPDDFGDFTIESSGLTMTGFDDSYSPPADLDRYEWWARATDGNPTSSDPDLITTTPKCYFSLNSGTWFLFGRIVDRSGNYNSSYATSLGSASLSLDQEIITDLVADLGDKFDKTIDTLDNVIDGTLYKKSFKTNNLVNNPTSTEDITGWSITGGGTIEKSFLYRDGGSLVGSKAISTLKSVAPSVNQAIRSGFIEVDPHTVYKMSVSLYGVAETETANTWSDFGVVCYNISGGGSYPFYYYPNTRTEAIQSTHNYKYFWEDQHPTDQWYDITAYLIPSGYPLAQRPPLQSPAERYVMMSPDCQRIRFFLLNYSLTAAVTRELHFANMEVVPVSTFSQHLLDANGDFDDVTDGTTYKKVDAGSVDGSGRVDALHDGVGFRSIGTSQDEIALLSTGGAFDDSRLSSNIFKKSTDDLDDITQGSTNYFVDANGYAGANRAYDAIDSNTHIVAPIYDVLGDQLLFDNTYKQFNYDLVISGTLSVGNPAGQHIYLDGPNAVLKFVTDTATRSSPIITIDDNIYGTHPGIKMTNGLFHDTFGSAGTPLDALSVWDLESHLNLASDEAKGVNLYTYFYSTDGDGDNYGFNSEILLGGISSSVARAYAVRGYVSMGAKTSTQTVAAIYGEATVASNVYAGYFSGDIFVTGVSYTDDLQIRYNASNKSDITVDSSGYMDIQTTGNHSFWNTGENYYVEIGNAFVGYVGHTGFAGFGHISSRTTGGYAFLADSSGNSYINAATGYVGYLRVNNATIASWDSDEFDIATGKFLDADDVLKPVILEPTGTDSARYVSTQVRRVGGGATDSTKRRDLVHWWISTSDYGAPASMAGTQNVSVSTGTQIDPSSVAAAGLNTSLTDSSGNLAIYITNSHTTVSTTYYFMAEVSGIVYSQSFTVFTDVV